jgi:hypothetical protein
MKATDPQEAPQGGSMMRCVSRTSYNYPSGDIMPKACHYCKGALEPEDDESGRCEWCRMPWGPLSAANNKPSEPAAMDKQ